MHEHHGEGLVDDLMTSWTLPSEVPIRAGALYETERMQASLRRPPSRKEYVSGFSHMTVLFCKPSDASSYARFTPEVLSVPKNMKLCVHPVRDCRSKM